MSGIIIDVETRIDKAQKDLHALNSTVSGVASSVNGLVDNFKRATMAIGGMAAAGGSLAFIAHLSTGFTEIENKIALVVGRTNELSIAQAKLQNIADSTRTSLEDSANIFSALGRSVSGMSVSQNAMMQATKTIQQSMAISGASAESARAAITQLGQGLASGTLRGEELNSVLEQAPRIAKAIADDLKVGTGELRNIAAAGKLTSTTVFNAILNQSKSINAEFGKMKPTLAQGGLALKEAMKSYLHDLDKGSGFSDAMASQMMNISAKLRLAGVDAFTVGMKLADGFNKAKNMLAPFVTAIISVVKALTKEIVFVTNLPVVQAQFQHLKSIVLSVFNAIRTDAKTIFDVGAMMHKFSALFLVGLLALKFQISRVGLWEALKTDLPKAAKFLGDQIKQLLTYKLIAGAISNFVDTANKALSKLFHFEFSFGSLAEVFDKAKIKFTGFLNFLKDFKDEVVTVFKESGIEDSFKLLMTAISAQFARFSSGLTFKDVVHKISASLKTLATNLPQIVDFVIILEKGFLTLIKAAIGLVFIIGKISVALEDTFVKSGASAKITQSVNVIKKAVLDIQSSIQEGTFVDLLKEKVSDFGSVAVDKFKDVKKSIADMFAASGVGEAFVASFKFVKQFMSELVNSFRGQSKGFDTVLNALTNFGDKAINIFKNIWDKVIGHSWWTDTIDSVISSSKSLWDNVKQGFELFKNNIISGYEVVYGKLDSIIAKHKDKLSTTFSNISLKIKEAPAKLASIDIKANIVDMKDSFVKFKDYIVKAMAGVIEDGYLKDVFISGLQLWIATAFLPTGLVTSAVILGLGYAFAQSSALLIDSIGRNFGDISLMRKFGMQLGAFFESAVEDFVKALPNLISAGVGFASGFLQGFLESIPVIGSAIKGLFSTADFWGLSGTLGFIGALLFGKDILRLVSYLGFFESQIESMLGVIARVGRFMGGSDGVISTLLFGNGRGVRTIAALFLIADYFNSFESIFMGSAVGHLIAQGGLLYLLFTGRAGLNAVLSPITFALSTISRGILQVISETRAGAALLRRTSVEELMSNTEAGAAARSRALRRTNAFATRTAINLPGNMAAMGSSISGWVSSVFANPSYVLSRTLASMLFKIETFLIATKAQFIRFGAWIGRFALGLTGRMLIWPALILGLGLFSGVVHAAEEDGKKAGSSFIHGVSVSIADGVMGIFDKIANALKELPNKIKSIWDDIDFRNTKGGFDWVGKLGLAIVVLVSFRKQIKALMVETSSALAVLRNTAMATSGPATMTGGVSSNFRGPSAIADSRPGMFANLRNRFFGTPTSPPAPFVPATMTGGVSALFRGSDINPAPAPFVPATMTGGVSSGFRGPDTTPRASAVGSAVNRGLSGIGSALANKYVSGLAGVAAGTFIGAFVGNAGWGHAGAEIGAIIAIGLSSHLFAASAWIASKIGLMFSAAQLGLIGIGIAAAGVLGVYLFGEGDSINEKFGNVWKWMQRITGFTPKNMVATLGISAESKHFLTAQGVSPGYDLAAIERSRVPKALLKKLDNALEALDSTISDIEDSTGLGEDISQAQRQQIVDKAKQVKQFVSKAQVASNPVIDNFLNELVKAKQLDPNNAINRAQIATLQAALDFEYKTIKGFNEYSLDSFFQSAAERSAGELAHLAHMKHTEFSAQYQLANITPLELKIAQTYQSQRIAGADPELAAKIEKYVNFYISAASRNKKLSTSFLNEEKLKISELPLANYNEVIAAAKGTTADAINKQVQAQIKGTEHFAWGETMYKYPSVDSATMDQIANIILQLEQQQAIAIEANTAAANFKAEVAGLKTKFDAAGITFDPEKMFAKDKTSYDAVTALADEAKKLTESMSKTHDIVARNVYKLKLDGIQKVIDKNAELAALSGTRSQAAIAKIASELSMSDTMALASQLNTRPAEVLRGRLEDLSLAQTRLEQGRTPAPKYPMMQDIKLPVDITREKPLASGEQAGLMRKELDKRRDAWTEESKKWNDAEAEYKKRVDKFAEEKFRIEQDLLDSLKSEGGNKIETLNEIAKLTGMDFFQLAIENGVEKAKQTLYTILDLKTEVDKAILGHDPEKVNKATKDYNLAKAMNAPYEQKNIFEKLSGIGMNVTPMELGLFNDDTLNKLSTGYKRIAEIDREFANKKDLTNKQIKDLYKEREGIVRQGEDAMALIQYSSYDKIKSALSDTGGMSTLSILGATKASIKSILGLDAAFKELKRDTKNPMNIDQFIEANKQAAMLERAMARVKLINASFEDKLSAVKEVFNTDISNLDFSRLSGNLGQILIDTAQRFKQALSEELATNGMSDAAKGILEGMDQLSKDGAYINFFASFREDMKESLTDGVSTAFDKVKSALPDLGLDFGQFQNLSSSKQAEYKSKALDVKTMNNLFTLPNLSQYQADIINKVGKGTPVQEMMKELEQTFSKEQAAKYAAVSKSPIEIPMNNLTESTNRNTAATDRLNETISGKGTKEAPTAFQSPIKTAADKYGVDPALLGALVSVESGFKNGLTSKAGAQGLTQLMPVTQAKYGVTDPFNVQQNLDAGAHYLKDLIDQQKNLSWALAAYNAGPGDQPLPSGGTKRAKRMATELPYAEKVLKRYAEMSQEGAVLPQVTALKGYESTLIPGTKPIDVSGVKPSGAAGIINTATVNAVEVMQKEIANPLQDLQTELSSGRSSIREILASKGQYDPAMLASLSNEQANKLLEGLKIKLGKESELNRITAAGYDTTGLQKSILSDAEKEKGKIDAINMSISLTANRLNEAEGFLKQMPNNITSFLEVYSGLNAETVAYMSEAQKSILKTMTLDALHLQKQIDDAKLLGQPTDEASSKLALLKDSIKEMGDAANASAIQAREAGKSFASGIQGGFNDALKGLMHNEKTAGKSAFQTFADKLKQNLIDSTISSFSAGVTNSLGFGKGDAVEKMASGLGEGIFKMFDKGLNMIPGASTASKATGTFLSKDVGNFFKNDVGNFFGFAEGGPIVGPGTGTSDSIMAKLSNGEFVINAKSTAKYGNLINAINNDKLPKFALGGAVSQPNAYSNRPALFSNTPVLSQATSTVITVDGGEDLIASAKDLSNASTDLTTSAGIGASLWQQIADMYNSVGDTALNVGGTIVDVGKEVGKFFVDKSKWVWDGTINLYDKAKGLLNTAGNFIWDGAINIAGTIKDNLPSVSAIVDWGSTVYNKSIIPTIIEKGTAAANAIVDWGSKIFNKDIIPTITEKGTAAATAIIDWGSTAYKNTIDMGKEIGTKIESIAKNIWEGSDGNGGIAGSISTAYKSTVDFTNTIGTNLSNKASTIWTGIKDGIGTAYTGTVELGSEIGTGLLEKATPIWNSIKEGISIDPTSVIGKFTLDTSNAVIDAGKVAWTGTLDMASGLKKWVSSIKFPAWNMKDWGTTISGAADSLSTKVVKLFTSIPLPDFSTAKVLGSDGKTQESLMSKITDTVSGWYTTSVNNISAAGNIAWGSITKVGSSIYKAGAAITKDIGDWVGNLEWPKAASFDFSSLTAPGGKIWNSFSNWVIDVVDSLPNLDFLTNLLGIATGGQVTKGGVIRPNGSVQGPGTSTSDSIVAKLSDGEYVTKANIANKYNDILVRLNRGESIESIVKDREKPFELPTNFIPKTFFDKSIPTATLPGIYINLNDPNHNWFNDSSPWALPPMLVGFKNGKAGPLASNSTDLYLQNMAVMEEYSNVNFPNHSKFTKDLMDNYFTIQSEGVKAGYHAVKTERGGLAQFDNLQKNLISQGADVNKANDLFNSVYKIDTNAGRFTTDIPTSLNIDGSIKGLNDLNAFVYTTSTLGGPALEALAYYHNQQVMDDYNKAAGLAKLNGTKMPAMPPSYFATGNGKYTLGDKGLDKFRNKTKLEDTWGYSVDTTAQAAGGILGGWKDYYDPGSVAVRKAEVQMYIDKLANYANVQKANDANSSLITNSINKAGGSFVDNIFIPSSELLAAFSSGVLTSGEWGIDKKGTPFFKDSTPLAGVTGQKALLDSVTDIKTFNSAEKLKTGDNEVSKMYTALLAGKGKLTDLKVDGSRITSKTNDPKNDLANVLKKSIANTMKVDQVYKQSTPQNPNNIYHLIEGLLNKVGKSEIVKKGKGIATDAAAYLWSKGTDLVQPVDNYLQNLKERGYIDSLLNPAGVDIIPDAVLSLSNLGKTNFPFTPESLGEKFSNNLGKQYYLKEMFPNDSLVPGFDPKTANENLNKLRDYIASGDALTYEQMEASKWTLGSNSLDYDKLRPSVLEKILNWIIPPAYGSDLPPTATLTSLSTKANDTVQKSTNIISDQLGFSKDSTKKEIAKYISEESLGLTAPIPQSLLDYIPEKDVIESFLPNFKELGTSIPIINGLPVYGNSDLGSLIPPLSPEDLGFSMDYTAEGNRYNPWDTFLPNYTVNGNTISMSGNWAENSDQYKDLMSSISSNMLDDFILATTKRVDYATGKPITNIGGTIGAFGDSVVGMLENYLGGLLNGNKVYSGTSSPFLSNKDAEQALGNAMSVGGPNGNKFITSLDEDLMSRLGDGLYYKLATGGLVTGPGTGVSDSIPTMLSNGEFVINAAATARNRQLLEAINSGASISSAASPIMAIPTASKSADGANSVTNNSVINMNITGDISRQTRAEISQMLPQIAAGVNQYNRERNYRG